MLLDFTPTVNPDNRFERLACCGDCFDQIIIGATVEHLFLFPFQVEGYLKRIEVCYEQGIHSVLHYEIDSTTMQYTDNLRIIPIQNRTALQIYLPVEDTTKFTANGLDTRVQVKFTTQDDEILFSDYYWVKVLKPVEGL